jgi:hypothetical protein
MAVKALMIQARAKAMAQARHDDFQVSFILRF